MKLRPFERIALLSGIVLFLFLGVLALVSYQVGLPKPQVIFENGAEGLIGGRGPVEIRFQQDMDRLTVESRLSFEPVWAGKWQWTDERTLRFLPANTLGEGAEITLHLAEGARSRDGRVLRQPFDIELRVRPASVVFLNDPFSSPELMRIDPANGEKSLLTESDGRVFDFSVSPDGEKVVYSRVNLRDGSDLVLINRYGREEKLLVECGEFACIEPAWTPDSRYVAYTRYESGLTASLVGGVGKVYVVDVETGQSNPLFNNPGLYGSLPVFSPDGNQVSFYDFNQQAIRLVNLLDGSSSIVPSRVAGRGSWSPDGSVLLVADWDGEGTIPPVTLFQLNLVNRQVSRFFEESFSVLDVGLPEWSPDGSKLVIGIQRESRQEGKQLWLFDKDGNPVLQITDNPQFNYSSYHWSPDGKKVVFQQVNLGQPDDLPRILIWYPAEERIELLHENGSFPQWMP